MWTLSHHELGYSDPCKPDLGGAPLPAPGLVPGCAGHVGLALVGEGEHAGNPPLGSGVSISENYFGSLGLEPHLKPWW